LLRFLLQKELTYISVKNSSLSDKELINAIQKGQIWASEHLYDQHRRSFLSWGYSYFKATPNDIEDAWQEAVVKFFEKVISGEIISLQCTIRTYLFALGGHKLKQYYRKTKRITWGDEAIKMLSKMSEPEIEDIWKEERPLLRKAVELLNPRCRDILLLRIYEERSIAELQEIFKYASKNAVSVTLHNCIETLMENIAKLTEQ